ncbi:MAG TPA: polysaccharide biosynthesis tyrosine autokinase, partial [Acidimicrobiales bacterium]|nr:polysaccharide biosynthesis tyrosine autokinase [Acidimicrobiales bacterium]
MTAEFYSRDPNSPASPDLDLRRYLRGLLRRKLMVALVVLLAVATAVGVAAWQSPLYQGVAQVVVQPKSTDSLFQPTTPQSDPQVSVATEIQVIKSPPVQAAVVAKLGPVSKVSASQVGTTLVIQIRGSATTSRRAAQVANAYASAYLQLSKSQAVSALTQAAQQLQAQISTLQAQVDQIDNQLADASTAKQQALTSNRSSLLAQEDTFRQQLSEVDVQASLTSGGAQLVSSASPPKKPVQPTPVRDVILAVMAGLLLGIGLAILAEYLDDTIRSAEDLETFHPIPTLAAVPNFGRRSKAQAPSLALEEGRYTPAVEAYRSLRTAVQLLGVVRPQTVIQFTSAAPREGKTTTVANLASVLADAGRRVAVVDCDLRRPLLHHAFGLDNEAGLTSVLLGDVSLAEALRQVPGYENLFLLAAGASAPNPSELLSLKETSEILYTLQSQFDLVLIDSPPVLPVTDAVVLSEWVEAVIIDHGGHHQA